MNEKAALVELIKKASDRLDFKEKAFYVGTESLARALNNLFNEKIARMDIQDLKKLVNIILTKKDKV